MRALEVTKDRQWERDRRAWKHEGLGATDGAQALVRFYFDEYQEITKRTVEGLKSSRGFRGPQRVILTMDTDKLTYLLLYSGMCAVGLDEPRVTDAIRVIGRAIEDQAYGDAFAAWNKTTAAKLEKTVKARHSSYLQRRAALRAHAKREQFVFEDWSDKERIAAGKTAIDMLLSGPLFAIDEDQCFTLTEPATLILDILMQELVLKRLVSLPQTGPVAQWSSLKLHIEGLPYGLVRTHQKLVKRHVQAAIDAGEMRPALEALNHAQAVQWRINDRVYDLVRECYERGISVEGLPPKRDLPVPEKPKNWEDMTETERRLWKRKASSVRVVNRGYIGERVVLARDLAEAEILSGAPFWTPMNFDYRGRVYGMSHFNFQRADHIRALFEFQEGQVVDARGLYWLKVHVANTGDFDKISKQPFDIRVAWVDEILDTLLACANAPLRNIVWTKADKPFGFVAACMALRDALANKPVHIPVSFDGSCSGLQHLCAMSRSEEGRLVNLTPLEKPQDIYQTVADLVKQRVTADLGGEHDAYAKMCLDYGINRSLIKRNVMTYSYSSRRFGMQNQLIEDTMKPLSLKVLAGDLEKHPFGEDGGFRCARYLATHVYAAIEGAISKPAEVMDFLRRIARLMANNGHPVTWSTPTGFPVMLRYPKMEIKQLDVFLHNQKLRLQPLSATETNELDSYRAANAVAPSFVHSLDAAHLHMVCLEAKTQGINSIALVHDSFGCLPNDADRFRSIIKSTFVKMYEEHDVLQQLLERAYETLGTKGYKLPPRPHNGTLELQTVHRAEYAFA